MKQIDNLILCMTKEKPLERIRALEQKINEVEKISNLEDVINQIKKELWSTKKFYHHRKFVFFWVSLKAICIGLLH